MRQQDVFKKVGNILQELNEQYEYLKTQGDNIDDLELELFAANANFLSDHLEVLRKLNASLVKSLPAHEQQAAIVPPIAENTFEPKLIEEPVAAINEPETIVEPPVAFVEEVPQPEAAEPEPVIELPASFEDEMPEPETAIEEPTLEEYYHIDTPEEEPATEPESIAIPTYVFSPEATPVASHYHVEAEEQTEEEQPETTASDFHFDFTTAPQQQEDADEYTSKQFQYQPEETGEHETEPSIDEETEEVVEENEEYKEAETTIPAYRFEEPVAESPEPAQPVYHYEEPVAESPIEHHVEPASFEPETTPIEIAETPAPEIDIKAESGHDMFSFMRTAEPETIRHELTLDEAYADEDETGSINQSYSHTPAEPETPTVAEAMAATQPEITPEPAAIPTFQLNQTPPAPVAAEPAPIAEPERPLTLNERLSSNAAVNATAASAQPIKDLKGAITLNDKMLFVRDLFNGYSLAYSEAIEILNRFNNFDDAERFLNTNYVEKNHWADKPTTNEKFFDLLRRRFA